MAKNNYELLTGGYFYSPKYNKQIARMLEDFVKIGERELLQGPSHRYIFMKNPDTGECAIIARHIWEATVCIFKNKEDANNHYKKYCIKNISFE